MCNPKTHIKDSNHHRTKYQESGNLNIAETRGTVAETQRLTRVSISGYIAVSHVSVAAFSTEPEHFSVSGITHFRNRYHVNKLRKHEITFGNKFVSFSFFGANVDLRSGYMSFFFSVSVRFRCVNYVDVSKELLAHTEGVSRTATNGQRGLLRNIDDMLTE